MLQIITGKSEVIASGKLQVFNDKETIFKFQEEGESISIIINFGEDPKRIRKASPKRTFEIIDESTLKIIFSNYNDPRGIYTPKPVELGTLNNRKLSFAYNVSKTTSSPSLREFSYTFYLDTEIPNPDGN